MSPPPSADDSGTSPATRRLDFNLVLQRYAVERFLYRLSVSDEVDRFT